MKFATYARHRIRGHILSGFRARSGKPGTAKHAARTVAFSSLASDEGDQSDPFANLAVDHVELDIEFDPAALARLEGLLGRLAWPTRRLVERHCISGLSYTEAGAMEEPPISAKKAENRIRRGLKKLRRLVLL